MKRVHNEIKEKTSEGTRMKHMNNNNMNNNMNSNTCINSNKSIVRRNIKSSGKEGISPSPAYVSINATCRYNSSVNTSTNTSSGSPSSIIRFPFFRATSGYSSLSLLSFTFPPLPSPSSFPLLPSFQSISPSSLRSFSSSPSLSHINVNVNVHTVNYNHNNDNNNNNNNNNNTTYKTTAKNNNKNESEKGSGEEVVTKRGRGWRERRKCMGR